MFLWIDGPAGRLEGRLELPEGQAPASVAVVAHPHPLYGGTMHSKVVRRLARGLLRNGAAVLRFNFRGAGRSEGVHDNGRGETEDARACLAWLQAQHPGLPYTLAGFSFGSRIVLNLGCELASAERIIAAGFPARGADVDGLLTCTRPKVFIQSTHDEHGPRQDLEALFARLPEPKRLVWIEASDHFFNGGLDELEEAVYSLNAAS